MNKVPFQITAEQKDKIAQIRIIGHIGWRIDAESFRQKVDELVEAGCTGAHLYINSPGGSCFDANEILNILQVFKGNITGEGGAIVASAAAYIATHCDAFEMPENGKLMIHKPAGGVSGTAEKIESYLKMLRDLDTEYYEHFKAKAKDKKNFKEQWLKGDYWLTAKEAKREGFISKVKKQFKMDAENAMMIQAVGFEAPKTEDINQKTEINMNKLQNLIAGLLGVSADASVDTLVAKVKDALDAKATLEKQRDEFKVKVKAFEQKEKEALTAEATQLVDEAVKAGRLDAKGKEAMMKLFASDHEAGKNAIEALPKAESITARIEDGKGTPTESAWEARKREIDERNK